MFALRQVSVLAMVLVSLVIAGCENAHPANIPENALMGSEGNGVLASTAPQDGHVYVYDVGGDRMVYSGAVAKGQSVVVNTDQNMITVDGKVRADHILNQGDKHRIYFDETPATAQHVTVEETTVTRTNTAGN